MAEHVDPQGRVYAADCDQRAFHGVEEKAERHGYENDEAHVSSASITSFKKDDSVDFILANRLLCLIAPQYHESAVMGIRRIIKPAGRPYISVAKAFFSYVERAK